jgi:hypothetical protein
MGTIYDKDWDHERQQYVSSRKVGKPLGAGERHIPNKAERKALARLMQASGLTEEEVRENKDNRRKLAQAAKDPMRASGHRHEYKVKMARRRIAAELGVLVTDPQVEARMKAPRKSNWGFAYTEYDRIRARR